jgi:muramoyltetrapeptide carboxypeptidase
MPPLKRPFPLRPGAPIAVAAPASAPHDLEAYRAGLDRLRDVYDVRSAWHPGPERGYLAAPDADRARALHDAIRDPSIQAIVCARGGYGCLRLLPHLDWATAREHPTLLVGYSDVTALHLAFYAQAGWTGLSGPVVTEWARADEETLSAFRALAEGKTPELGKGQLHPLRSGTATGPLLGGNLSVLTRLIGTPYAPDWTGAILVLEDVAEAPYRIDRMLAHLQNAGVLEAVAGVVLGSFRTPDADPDRPTLSLDTIFRDYLGNRPYPVATGLPYGHLLPRCSLPIGGQVQLDATSEPARLSLLAPLVAA